MSTSIVFGANGYLGSHLIYFLIQAGHTVLPFGHAPTSKYNFPNYQSVDLTDSEAISNLDFEVSNIFVFAGMTGTEAGFDQYQKFLKVNEFGLLNILNHRRKSKGNAKIIFPSTRLVYQGIKDKFLLETDPKEAKTIYAQNKIACEGYLEMYANRYQIPYTTFRICVPYGNIFDNQYSYGTIGFFLRKAMAKEAITLYGNGAPKRTFSHVGDICNSIIATLNTPKSVNQTFNIGSDDNYSLKEVAEKIAAKFGVGISFNPWPEVAAILESGDTIFDGTKLKTLLNYQYQFSFDTWLKNLK